MPNRYVRESWIESAAVDALDAHADRFFLRLILKADDFGRYTANPVALKNTLYPLKDDVRATDSSRWLAACEKAGLVRCYETPKGRFLEIPKFGQRTRATSSKFPGPSDAKTKACQTDDGQMTDIGQSSAHENENEDEDGIRGRERDASADAGQAPPMIPDPLEIPPTLKTPEFVKAWGIWMNIRKGLKKPKDWVSMFRAQLDWLASYDSATACEILGASTRNGWTGLFETKGGTRPQRPKREGDPDWSTPPQP